MHCKYISIFLQARRGGFKDTPADDLLCAVLVATLQQTGVDPAVSHIYAFFIDLSGFCIIHLEHNLAFFRVRRHKCRRLQGLMQAHMRLGKQL